MKIEKIAVLVEMNNGNVHQVLATKEQKETALQFLKNEKTGILQVTDKVESIEFEP